MKTIDDMARDQHQRERGHELQQPDQTQIERAAGQRVHLPTDRNHQHLVGAGAGDPRPPKAHEGREPAQWCRGGVVSVQGRSEGQRSPSTPWVGNTVTRSPMPSGQVPVSSM